jgi:hypothetical protein
MINYQQGGQYRRKLNAKNFGDIGTFGDMGTEIKKKLFKK